MINCIVVDSTHNLCYLESRSYIVVWSNCCNGVAGLAKMRNPGLASLLRTLAEVVQMDTTLPNVSILIQYPYTINRMSPDGHYHWAASPVLMSLWSDLKMFRKVVASIRIAYLASCPLSICPRQFWQRLNTRRRQYGDRLAQEVPGLVLVQTVYSSDHDVRRTCW